GIRDKLVTGVQTCALPIFIGIMANIGSHETAEAAAQNGADGVGLFRLEQLYLGRDRPPDSDELFAELLGILKPLRGKCVTIRLRSEERRVGKECGCGGEGG